MNSPAAPALKVTKSRMIPLFEAGLSEVELENLIVQDPSVLGLAGVYKLRGSLL
jgi:hypothetical protein